ncbi:MAG: hypothetical protein KAT43_04980 [Nanoarchaeota archaeon]|nr:hypothetical protein [Nanoarchaeota archaeon]
MSGSMENQTQLEEKLEELQKMIKVLEWDRSRQQINPAKMDKLENLKDKEKELVEQIDKFRI